MSELERFATLQTYPFVSTVWRAQPLYVVDGDTVDLFVDRGFHHYSIGRFRFLDIDTPELNSRDDEERDKAKSAKSFVQGLLDTSEKTSKVDLKVWPLSIETAKDPDSFGRWLCRIFFTDDMGEMSVNAMLLERGLAVPYRK